MTFENEPTLNPDTIVPCGWPMQASVEAPRLPVMWEVDPSELIASIDVAEILGLAHASSVATYLRRYDDFPRPVVELQRSHVRLWRRPEIEKWARAHQAKRHSA